MRGSQTFFLYVDKDEPAILGRSLVDVSLVPQYSVQNSRRSANLHVWVVLFNLRKNHLSNVCFFFILQEQIDKITILCCHVRS